MNIIVEIGAHTGTETMKFLQDATALVYAFEPNQKRFSGLAPLSTQYPRLTLLPFAVDLGDNQEPLFHDEDDGQDSLSPLNNKYNGKRYTMTWTIRLDTFLRLYHLDRIDYLRIDAPWNEANCLHSLAEMTPCLQRGRIRCYGDKSEVVTWLYDNGFSMQEDTTSNNSENPDIRFWRNP